MPDQGHVLFEFKPEDGGSEKWAVYGNEQVGWKFVWVFRTLAEAETFATLKTDRDSVTTRVVYSGDDSPKDREILSGGLCD